MKESYSDFSIISKYIELKNKYEDEVKRFAEGNREREEKVKQQVAALQQEVAKRNDYIKAQEQKLQELTQKMAEKDEQLKTMGLQLHKIKLSQSAPQEQPMAAEPDDKKKKGLFK